MKYTRLEIPDLVLCEPKIHEDNRGFVFEAFKKDSFNLLKGALRQEEYEIMNQVSEIRANWVYQPPMLYKIILSLNSFALNHFFKKN